MPIYGIEQEIPLLRDNKTKLVDYSNTGFKELDAIIDQLPTYEEDNLKLRIGDLGIKKKRWYIECFERFDEHGSFITAIPKSLEIRTSPCNSASEAVNQLVESYRMLKSVTDKTGLFSTWLSFHPFATQFIPEPQLNTYELHARAHSPELVTETIAQLSYGPDISISFNDTNDLKITDSQLIDIAKKLTYYSPGIIPYSFSSPFYNGTLWEGLSVRTFMRTGKRPACIVYLYNQKNVISSNPTLTLPARIPFEQGRIQFKAFDSCNDPSLYLSLFALIEGIVLDATLPGRAIIPDEKMHKLSAQQDFQSPEIYTLSMDALLAARKSLPPEKATLLEPLFEMIDDRSKLPVYKMIDTYNNTQSIIKTLGEYENLNI